MYVIKLLCRTLGEHQETNVSKLGTYNKHFFLVLNFFMINDEICM